MEVTPAVRKQLIQLTIALYNAAPGKTVLAELEALFVKGASLSDIATALGKTENYLSLYPDSLSNSQFIDKYINIYLGSEASTQAKADLKTWALSVLEPTFGTPLSRGAAMQIVNDELAASIEPRWANAQQAFKNKTEISEFYSIEQGRSGLTLQELLDVISTVTSDPQSLITAKTKILATPNNEPNPGETFTFTDNPSNNLTGTEKDDTFRAAVTDTGTNDTFTAGDAANGGNGKDSIDLTVSGSNNTVNVAAATLSNIEIINVRALLTNTTTTTNLQANEFQGVTEFYADRATSAVVISGLVEGQAGGMKGNGTTANGPLTLDYANAATSGIINVSGGTTQGTVTQSGTGITSNTLNSTGEKANSLSSISLSGSANKALTINAAVSLDSGNITGFTGTDSTITIKGAADNLDPTATNITQGAVSIGTVESNTVKTIDASGLTEGGVMVALSSNAAIEVTGGAGDDAVMTGTALTTGSVNAGNGTADLLAISNSSHLNSSTLGAKYTNFEVLRANDGVSVDMDNIAGITGVQILDNTSNNTGFIDLSANQAAAIQILTAHNGMVASVKGAATNGQLDVVTMTFDNGNTTNNEDINTSGSNINSQDVETFNFIAVDQIEISSTQNMAQWTNINISGEANISLTTSSQSIKTNSIIESTTTGNAVIDAQNSSNFGIKVMTGSGNDSVKMANNDLSDTISTGAGNDVIHSNGSGTNGSDGQNRNTDVITTGTGEDVIHLSTGSGNSTSVIDSITDVDFGTSTSAVDSLVFRGIGTNTTEVVIVISSSDQANASAQSSLQSAAGYVLQNTATNDGNVTLFEYGDDKDIFLIVNGSGNTSSYSASQDLLIKVTGVTGTLDTGDFSFT